MERLRVHLLEDRERFTDYDRFQLLLDRNRFESIMKQRFEERLLQVCVHRMLNMYFAYIRRNRVHIGFDLDYIGKRFSSFSWNTEILTDTDGFITMKEAINELHWKYLLEYHRRESRSQP
jgi:hypothetical protein